MPVPTMLEMTSAEALKSPSCRRSPGLAAVRGALGIGSKTSLQGGGPAATGEDGEARVLGEGGVDVSEEAAEELRAAVGGHDFGVPAVGAEAGDGGGVHVWRRDEGDLPLSSATPPTPGRPRIHSETVQLRKVP
jgi:hypothetical protein